MLFSLPRLPRAVIYRVPQQGTALGNRCRMTLTVVSVNCSLLDPIPSKPSHQINPGSLVAANPVFRTQYSIRPLLLSSANLGEMLMQALGLFCSLFCLNPRSSLQRRRVGLARVSADEDGVGTTRVWYPPPHPASPWGGRAWTCSNFFLFFFFYFIKPTRLRIPTKWDCSRSEALRFKVGGLG